MFIPKEMKQQKPSASHPPVRGFVPSMGYFIFGSYTHLSLFFIVPLFFSSIIASYLVHNINKQDVSTLIFHDNQLYPFPHR